MLKKNHSEGKYVGEILIYALSTCVWCKKTKRFFQEQGIGFDYIDVDLLNDEDEQIAKKEMHKYGTYTSFPTIIINNEKCILGFDEEKLSEAVINVSK